MEHRRASNQAKYSGASAVRSCLEGKDMKANILDKSDYGYGRFKAKKIRIKIAHNV